MIDGFADGMGELLYERGSRVGYSVVGESVIPEKLGASVESRVCVFVGLKV